MPRPLLRELSASDIAANRNIDRQRITRGRSTICDSGFAQKLGAPPPGPMGNGSLDIHNNGRFTQVVIF
jgi:hypothetical protein